MANDWKAFFNPRLVFVHPIKALGIVSALVGVLTAAPDLNNRWLAFGLFLLSSSLAVQKSRRILCLSSDSDAGQKTQGFFSFAALFQSFALWAFTGVFLLLCLHQLGMTPRLDAYLSAWAHSHPLL